jgi:hypothetical protein
MNYVQKVESSLKGGVNVELGQRTVLFGPNGSGKTSIIQAIELASGGYVSDMEGRDRVKQSAALGRLFAEDDRMFAKVHLSEGGGFGWEMKHGTKAGSYKKPKQDGSTSISWPIQEMGAVLAGEAAAVKAWLEGKVVGGIAEEDVLGALPLSLHETAKRLIRKEGRTDFLSLGKAARNQAKNIRTAATRKENTITQMTQGIDTPMLASEKRELEKELEGLLQPQAGLTQEAYDNQVASVKSLGEEYAELEAKLKDLPSPSAAVSLVLIKIRAALQMIETHKEEAGAETDCWVCGTGDVAAIESRKKKLNEALSQLDAQCQIGDARARVQRRLADLGRQIQGFAHLGKTRIITDNFERKSEVMRILAQDNSARQAWDNAKVAKAEVDGERKQAAQLNETAKALESAGSALLNRRKSDFEAKVTAFLPGGDSLGVDLQSARVGLMRDGQLHSALSGAEWSRVLLALCSASGVDSTPSVLAPADRSWDRDTLTSVMVALNESPAQIILMSTVRPDPVDGWTLVEL